MPSCPHTNEDTLEQILQVDGGARTSTLPDAFGIVTTPDTTIEQGDRLWCPLDVDQADSDESGSANDVDFWDFFNDPPASPPRTVSGRLGCE
jgi:hypothetical protein